MKNPKEYKKPIAVSMGFLNACYLAFALVIYRYCGSELWASPCCPSCNNVIFVAWISSPALGSAGPLIKKLTYGIALPGLIMSSTVNQHVSRPHSLPPRKDNHWEKNIACCQVHICATTSRDQTSSIKDNGALGHLVWCFFALWGCCICYWRSCSLLWDFDFSPCCHRVCTYGRELSLVSLGNGAYRVRL